MKTWTVTWPTRPAGIYTQTVQAADPAGAVHAAALLDWPTAPGYEVAFDYTPEVWCIRRPRWLSLRVHGPDLTAPDPKNAFVPVPA